MLSKLTLFFVEAVLSFQCYADDSDGGIWKVLSDTGGIGDRTSEPCSCFMHKNQQWVGEPSSSPISSPCGLGRCEPCTPAQIEASKFYKANGVLCKSNDQCVSTCCEKNIQLLNNGLEKQPYESDKSFTREEVENLPTKISVARAKSVGVETDGGVTLYTYEDLLRLIVA